MARILITKTGLAIVDESIEFSDIAYQTKAIVSCEGIDTETADGIVWSDGVWGYLPSN